MVRQSAYALAAVALGLARDPGCGGVDDPEGGTNAPCTRTPDCRAGLTCSGGVCTDEAADASPPAPGSATEAGVKDASDDGG